MVWTDVFLPKDAPVPADFEDIDTIVARSDADPARRRHLEAARKALADREAEGITGLAALRLRKGWSQKRLSEEVGTSRSYIARLESGTEDILLGTARRVAAALEISLEQLDAALRARGAGK